MELISPAAFLEGFSPPVRQITSALRTVVREAVPDVLERVRVGWHLIGYDLPIRRYGVYFAYVAPETDHVHLGFEYGAFMEDPTGVLHGAGLAKQIRWLTFDRLDDIDVARTIALVREGARVAALTRAERLALALDRA